jgi:hypothetical protein
MINDHHEIFVVSSLLERGSFLSDLKNAHLQAHASLYKTATKGVLSLTSIMKIKNDVPTIKGKSI